MSDLKISKETLIRTIVLVIALLNSVLTMCNVNPLPFSDEQVYEGVSAVISVVATIWAWWKNNSFTKEAVIADEYKKSLKEK
ncbi:phage holin [Anaerofustis sp.]|uniref:phage holin n=1 Tax=Anaerofustis sp. TaxID=1872517 RepID=UPI0025B86346|nr:phage holin [Anaerofustis sp.]